MSNRQQRRKKPNNPLGVPLGGETTEKLSNFLQKLLAPPESVVDHLKRVEAKYFLDEVLGADDQNPTAAVPCLVIPLDALMKVELDYIHRHQEERSEKMKEITEAAEQETGKHHLRSVPADGRSFLDSLADHRLTDTGKLSDAPIEGETDSAIGEGNPFA